MTWRRGTGNRGLGMNWIRQDLRLAIYIRDELRCVYCGAEEGLTLDHVVPRAAGGDNSPDNLHTACSDCNEARGALGFERFLVLLWEHRAADKTTELRKLRARPVERTLAADLVRRYGSAVKAARAIQGNRQGFAGYRAKLLYGRLTARWRECQTRNRDTGTTG